ncbi:MAG: glycerol-3-phosphate dehydrogenase [Bacteroidetes bacterium GWF2_41_61]|jgi:glycerol-3-phosphate dehydrogenase (NAD(P)+)|nr:MAG: glycerol-3-phosphate dehydrogenase [Bacteroidetes bacterium GWE2_40_15]OFY34659.1 MAG: glycerol-3-phosphate dehydrogenase [Bacteroidetes bacterium GWF2_41_61]PKP06346.1 MAG: glycerol-3-phosphate dehydrogenase [Bacteroidetes bacterium HGW-Bacteroidetes-5]HBG23520.1 glycerol-3-phosphate dehydrogenase [Rikenellaceae bacterium]HBZ25865.1 glycerol-3-phosphate dehydrogenase [Rikenellaceae bacterium]
MDNFFDSDNLRYAMIGSGSWATALAKLILNNQESISWYVRDDEMIDQINRTQHNPYYLSAVKFDPKRVRMSSDINEIISESDVLVFCVPSAYFLKEAERINISLDDKFIISAIKGIIPGDNITIAEYFNHNFEIPFSRIGVVSGPCHAEEVAMEKLSYLTLSSKHIEVARSMCDIFSCEYIRTVPGTDIYGVEYAAVLKNIYAVAAGVCHALSYGDNFMAVLITSSFHEMRDFLHASHPDSKRKTSTSAYLGDLLVTCYSQFSRNRTFGSMIGKGYSVQSAQVEMNMVAEGYYGTKCIYEINKKYGVHMPIAEAMYRILYEEKYPAYIIKQLSENLQ